jgi:2-polyprenyl-6-methoxyphenol hydroxylase-like FAD-dependent oxidoreductase
MKVIIIGAGISGLTLAAALAQLASQHEVELYERDRSPGVRRKGYAVSLKGDAGLAVLERLGLRDAVLADGVQQVTNFVINDRHELLGRRICQPTPNTSRPVLRPAGVGGAGIPACREAVLHHKSGSDHEPQARPPIG